MKIQLSDHFDYKRLLRFVAPSILMLLCTSIYSIVDGFLCLTLWGKHLCSAESGDAGADGCRNDRFHGGDRWKRRGIHDVGRREKGTGE